MTFDRPIQALKWAGGKSKLLPTIADMVGNIEFNSMYEPFCGSAVLSTSMTTPPNRHISDINYHLINFYRTLLADFDGTVESIQSEIPSSLEQYLKLRTLHNSNPTATSIYSLNHTCFNGLYRVNREGRFNVPYGKRLHNVDVNKLHQFSHRLSLLSSIEHRSFIDTPIEAGALYILDPPYLNGFDCYDKSDVHLSDILSLCLKINDSGSIFVLFNRYSEDLASSFKGFSITYTNKTKTCVGGSPSSRTAMDEVIISNV